MTVDIQCSNCKVNNNVVAPNGWLLIMFINHPIKFKWGANAEHECVYDYIANYKVALEQYYLP